MILNGIISYGQYTISSYVVDKENRETIIGATIVIKGTARGSATDLNGYFQLTGTESGEYDLVVDHVSYQPIEIHVNVNDKSVLLDEIALVPAITSLGEISVIGIKPDEVGDKEIETSQLELTPKAIQSIPSARNDVFRAIRYLPGIEGAEPFSPLYSVRGGDPGENRVILDGVTIYNPYHFSTASGIFNVQTIKNLDMFIGGFGAEFGGSNSSIMHITTKEGNKNKLEGEFFPSLMSTKILLEFPAGKNSSMMVGGRYFYDLQSAFMLYNSSYFYDYNISYTNRINNKNWLSVKFFHSKDNTKYDFGNFFGYLSKSFDLEVYENMDMGLDNRWNNMAGSILLKKILTPSLYLTTQVYMSSHQSSNYSFMDLLFEIDDEEEPYDVKLYYNTLFNSKIMDLCGKATLNYQLGIYNTFTSGYEYNQYYFNNHAVINDVDKGEETRAPLKHSVFIEDKVKVGPVIVRPGIRYTDYSYYDQQYVEPRVNASINLSKGTRVKAAYGNYYQYIISMNTIEYEINQFLDYYYPLKDLKPSKSNHYILGFEQKIKGHDLSLKTDLYFKDIKRTYTFDLIQSEAETFTFSDKIQEGSGTAYGAEIMLEGQYKKFSGWLGYTFSKSFRSFPHIMNGKKYPFDYNRTHSANILLNFQVNPRLSYSTTLLVMSGQPRTIENYFQNYYYYNPINGKVDFYPIYGSHKKNNARLPMVIEWDIGLKKKIRKGFAADFQEFIGGDESYLNVTIGNLLFLRRNVIWYFPTGGEKFIPIGLNYIPYINAGYILKF